MANILNEKDSITLTGSSGNDSIRNAGANIVIAAYAGDDEIENYGASSTVNAGDGNDTIENWDNGISLFDDHYVQMNGVYISINGGTGNDYIRNGGESSTVNAGDGNDTIINYRSDSFIYGDNGNDSIVNEYGSNIFIDAGANNDYIKNERDGVTISGGKGNDTIENVGSEVILFGSGYGKDIVSNWQNKNSIKLTSGKINKTLLSGSDIILSLGKDSLTLKNAKNKVVIINNVNGSQTIINKERLGQTLSNYQSDQTLIGGLGEDSIYNDGARTSIFADEGDDTIENRASYSTINGGAGNDSVSTSNWAKNITIEGGASNDTLRINNSDALVFGGAGDDYIDIGLYNTGIYDIKNVTVNSGDGNNAIKVSYNVENVLINCGNGDNTINANKNSVVNLGTGNNKVYADGTTTIKTGGGHDTINASSGDNALVLGTKGNDQIWLGAYGYGGNMNAGLNITDTEAISRAGKGNDTIYGGTGKNIFEYAQGDGKDIIRNFGGEDILKITSGKISKTTTSGNDIVFKIGSGSVTLKNMKNHYLTVQDAKGNITTKLYGNTGYSQKNAVEKFIWYIGNTVFNHREDALNEAVIACTPFKSYQNFIDGLIKDCRNSKDGETFLEDYCGITNANADIGAMTGWEMGGREVKTGDKLFPTVNGNTYPSSTSFTRSGLTMNVPQKNTLNESEQEVVMELYNGKMESALNLIKESYGIDFKSDDVNFKKMTLHFYEKVGAMRAAYVSSSGLYVNMGNRGNHPDDLINHELTHIAQNAYFNVSLTKFMDEGMADLTTGGDNGEGLADEPDTLSEVLNKDLDSYKYAAGYIFWRYLGKKSSDAYDGKSAAPWKDGSKIVGTSEAELLTGSGKNQTIAAGAGNDTITAYGEKSQIYGNAGDDSILTSANAQKLTLSAGAGNDYIKNRGANVLFKYKAGDGSDVITGFNATSTLSISDDIYSTQTSYNDVIVTVGKGKITLSGAATLPAVNIDCNKILKITNKSKAKISAGSEVELINASARKKAVNITGNNLNNSIIGGAGADTLSGGAGNDKIWGNTGNDSLVGGNGADAISGGAGSDRIYGNVGNDNLHGGVGNDTLTGGKGIDSLWGDAGKDTFIYSNGDGRDIIYGFDNTDMLKITGKFSGTYSKAKDEIYFKVGNTANAITLKDFSATSFNVNGTNYKISSSKLVKK